MSYPYIYPFVAVVGQDDVKEGILLALVNPKIGGLLISGTKATAKSTLLRSAMALTEQTLVELPLSATEDRVFGHIDLEKTLADGKRIFLPGLLAKADQQILYIDEINLLRRDLLAAILQVHETHENKIEREGLSYSHPTDFMLIGTMNPEEGTLSDALLDRFGMFVNAQAETDPAKRQEIVRRVLAYEKDRIAFVKRYAEETEKLRKKVLTAQAIISQMEVPAPMLQLAAVYSENAWLAGHRGDIILLEATKAVAALAGRNFLIPDDMERAAYFVLPHRMHQPEQAPQEQPEQQPPQPPDQSSDDSAEMPPQNDAQELPPPPSNLPEDNDFDTNDDDSHEADTPPNPQMPLPPETWEDINKAFSALQLQVTMNVDRFKRKGSGKRQRTKTDLKQGRYIRAVPMAHEVTDLALDATIRAAAPYQKQREKHGLAIALEKDDLRQKVREKRTGTVFLFCVDASGSMGARHRMGAVKGAIYGLLQEAYQKRDRIGLITFRRNTAELLLPVTRSIDLAQKALKELPTGGKTPLAAALEMSLAVLAQLKFQDPEVRPVFLLVTDGRATSSLSGGNPVDEAIELGEKLRRTGAAMVVIDTETDFISMGIAKKLASSMGATYYHVKDLSDEKVLRIVQDHYQH
ncbi:MAG: VWA domain-containing protein [Negativicoccus succinicivorans]|uniref:VWA domain-containing protein n=1 Tax=Negativicoccus succinicivorans TaxID=620903 RepID=UPI00290CAC56|nr:VWA domain-containing protein [Negativicoccus succinicivorans]MDU5395674.1 VWA domain-containing protein [Negativicoccus succinicivorans]